MSIRSEIKHNLVNIPGWHTRRHLVVIESDDWGSIRMPSKEIHDKLNAMGYPVDNDIYCHCDGLATTNDLTNLFEVLDSVKDKNGNPAVMTANSVVANPDFDRIKESGYIEYYYEPFTKTLDRYPSHHGAFDMWKEGMAAGLFHPQFHGREHLNVRKWLAALQAGDKATLDFFADRTFGLTSSVSSNINNHYMGAFSSDEEEDMPFIASVIRDGLNMFEELFGYRSESFIATTYTWSPKIEPYLKESGVKYLQTIVSRKEPIGRDSGYVYKQDAFQGKMNRNGLIYLTRNCFYEPVPYKIVDNIGECVKRVEQAFRWGKAAVIGSHRRNFIGSIDVSNTDKTLVEFREILRLIVKLWPDVEFITSDQLGRIIEEEKNRK